MFKTTSAALLLAATIAPSAHAAATASPKFVNTPSAAFLKSTNNGVRSYTMAVVVRFDKALPRSGARVVIGPHLAAGQKLGIVQGGGTPHRIGDTTRHCYSIEVGRPRPVSTPKVGAHWKVGVTQNGVIKHTDAATLRAFPDGSAYGPAEARHLGCSSTSSKSATDALVGQRKHVQINQLLLYDDPAKSYINSLQTGQSFTAGGWGRRTDVTVH